MTEREMARKKAAARKARERKARNRRVVMTVALMLVVCVASIGGTIAWLTDTTESVTNTFSPSNIGLTLNESADLDFKMVPGEEIDKDPKVTITNDVDAWLFVEITESSNPDFDAYMSWTIADGWTLLSSGEGDSPDSYVYFRQVEADASVNDFGVISGNKVSVLPTVTKEMMTAITDTDTEEKAKPTLTFKAYAIQQSGFEPAVTDGVTAPFDDQIKEAALKAWNEVNSTAGGSGN